MVAETRRGVQAQRRPPARGSPPRGERSTKRPSCNRGARNPSSRRPARRRLGRNGSSLRVRAPGRGAKTRPIGPSCTRAVARSPGATGTRAPTTRGSGTSHPGSESRTRTPAAIPAVMPHSRRRARGASRRGRRAVGTGQGGGVRHRRGAVGGTGPRAARPRRSTGPRVGARRRASAWAARPPVAAEGIPSRRSPAGIAWNNGLYRPAPRPPTRRRFARRARRRDARSGRAARRRRAPSGDGRPRAPSLRAAAWERESPAPASRVAAGCGPPRRRRPDELRSATRAGAAGRRFHP